MSAQTSNIEALVTRVADRGVGLSLAADGQLRVTAAKGVIDEPLRAELSAHKAAIVEWLRGAAASRDDAPAPRRQTREGPAPLSHAQRRLWILDRIDPGSSAYSIPSAMRLRGPVDVDRLLRAVRAVVLRHESLRTRFAQVDGTPCQVVSPDADIDASVVDFGAHADRAQIDALVDEALLRETGVGFDLERGPLLRLRVYRVAADELVLYIAMHHIIGDGWSNGVFLDELRRHYAAIGAGAEAADLPALPLQYADYALWQQAYLDDARRAALIAHWRERLAGWQALELPLDKPRPPHPSLRGGRVRSRIDADTTRALRELGRAHGATLFTTLLAAFYALMRKYSGQQDLTIGTDVANRTRKEWEGLIGFFVNQLVVRADLSGNPRFGELVERVHAVCLDAYAHQELPFDSLVESLHEGREFNVSPFFQVKFIMQNTQGAHAGGFEPVELPHRHAKFDLTWSLSEGAGGVDIEIEYGSDVLHEATVRGHAAHYAELLAAFVAHPAERIDHVRIGADATAGTLARAQRSQEEHAARDVALAGLVRRWATATPDAPALVDGDAVLSYRRLDEDANRLARHLQSWGVGAETPVGVCLESSIDYATAAVAISKAGGVLVSIDPAYPEDRISHVLEASGLQVLISAERFLDRLPSHHLNLLVLVSIDGDRAAWMAASADDLNLPVHPDQLSYLIFTSGTTGKPKGVMVGCAGLHNLALAQGSRFELGAGKRVLQFASIGFDASVWELVMALGHGATLVCAPRASVMPGVDLARVIAARHVTHVTLPPSALAVMPETTADSLDVLVLAGEACKDEIVRRWGARTRVFNAYGPSEATVCSSIDAFDHERGGFGGSIGREIEGVGLYVVGVDGQLAAPGVPGELCIAGAALGRGYWNDPASTAARFVPDPFSQVPGARLYRSGDKARYRADGRVEFLGRIDQQVKIRGHRVELGEIETELLRQPCVREAVALVEKSELYAWVVAETDHALDEVALKKALRRHLPEYMIPRSITAIDRVPMTPNGKLDRAALPAPCTQRELEAQEQPATPIEESLARIWREVLGVEQVGTRDNFFDVGGHSLLLIQVQEQIVRQFQVEVSVAELFKYPTLHSLAVFLSDGERADRFARTDARVARRQQAGRTRAQRRHAEPAGAHDD